LGYASRFDRRINPGKSTVSAIPELRHAELDSATRAEIIVSDVWTLWVPDQVRYDAF
tara:strand:- start:3 stop:173 length:171 start_codon:yes stop_codon:yes gene_type:complete